MAEFRLPRIIQGSVITDAGGKAAQTFRRWWQSFAEKIETQEALQDETIAQVLANQLELTAQLAQIQTVTTSNAISSSWITPPSVLSAADAGSDATITIADFMRVYDDGTSVDITGGDLTGLAYSTTYAIYYDDADRDEATPTFEATTLTGTARHNYAAGRHYVDTITTPASGGGGTSGGGYNPPGGGGGDLNVP